MQFFFTTKKLFYLILVWNPGADFSSSFHHKVERHLDCMAVYGLACLRSITSSELHSNKIFTNKSFYSSTKSSLQQKVREALLHQGPKDYPLSVGETSFRNKLLHLILEKYRTVFLQFPSMFWDTSNKDMTTKNLVFC